MKPNDSIGFLINSTGRKVAQLLTNYFHTFDITTEQWSVLNSLGEQDGISQKDLASRVEKDQTNITRILDQLERKGLIQRMPNQFDRRSFLAFLTEEGSKLIEQLGPIEEEVLSIALKDLPEEKLDELKQTLLAIRTNINEHGRMER